MPGRSADRARPGPRIRRPAGDGARLLRAGGGRGRHRRRLRSRARRRTWTPGCPTRSCARRIAARSPRRPRRRSAPPSGRSRGSPRPTATATGALARTERALALAVGNTTDGDRLGQRRPRRARSACGTRCAPTPTSRRDRRRRPPLSVVIATSWRSWVCWRAGAGAGARWRRALRRRPALFPDVARAVGELRHDVLKHRAERARLLAESDAPRAEIAARDDGAAADLGGGRRRSTTALAQAAAGARQRAAGARARAGVRRHCTATSPAPRRCSRAPAPAPTRSSRPSTSACAVLTPKRWRRCSSSDRAPASTPRRCRPGSRRSRRRRGRRAAAGPPPRCRSPTWPSSSPSSTTRWRRSSRTCCATPRPPSRARKTAA